MASVYLVNKYPGIVPPAARIAASFCKWSKSTPERHRQSRDAAGGPCGLEVEAAGDAVEVEAFTRKVKVGDSFALHATEIDVL